MKPTVTKSANVGGMFLRRLLWIIADYELSTSHSRGEGAAGTPGKPGKAIFYEGGEPIVTSGIASSPLIWTLGQLSFRLKTAF